MATKKKASSTSKARRPKPMSPKAGFKPGHRYGKGGKMCK